MEQARVCLRRLMLVALTNYSNIQLIEHIIYCEEL